MENKMTDLGGRRKAQIPAFGVEDIPDFRVNALERYPNRGLLRVSFWEIDGIRHLSYDTDGFSCLRNLLATGYFQSRGHFTEQATEFYRFMIAVLSCAAEAEDRLLLREPFLFGVESVFQNIETGEIRLAYLPNPEKKDAQRILLDMLEETEEYLQEDQWKFHLTDLRKSIQLINYGYADLIKYLHRRLRETDLQDWPSRGMERGRSDGEQEEEVKREEAGELSLSPQNVKKQGFFRIKRGEK